MNQDITPSIFTGQSILEEDLNKEEIDSINSYISDISKIIHIDPDFIEKMQKNPKKWNPSIFNEFFKLLNEYIKNGNNKNINILLEAKSKIYSIISPQGRFKETASQTSSGLKNGSWFLYDDIQFSTPDLLSIMTPLCSDNPSLF